MKSALWNIGPINSCKKVSWLWGFVENNQMEFANDVKNVKRIFDNIIELTHIGILVQFISIKIRVRRMLPLNEVKIQQ
jgi:hypothetical protein